MDLTSEEKIDMSLDEIIQLQWQKQNAEYWQRRKRLRNRRYCHNRAYPPYWGTNNYASRRFSNSRRWHPLGLFTRKYRQLTTYKSIQRAKYTLVQQYLRKRNEAYRRWEERSRMHGEGHYSVSDDREDVTSNYSTYSTKTDKNLPSLQNTCQWINERFNLDNIPDNLTIKFRNNLALRSRLNRRKVGQHLNYRRALTMKRSPITVRELKNYPFKNGLILKIPSSPQNVPKTLNERFTALMVNPAEKNDSTGELSQLEKYISNV